jgi:hypothetical protein
MKKIQLTILFLIVFSLVQSSVNAQCSICSKTAMQMGTKPAQGLNEGILYLMAAPYLAIGVVAFKWWQNEKRKS